MTVRLNNNYWTSTTTFGVIKVECFENPTNSSIYEE